jgi:hypothetical protein
VKLHDENSIVITVASRTRLTAPPSPVVRVTPVKFVPVTVTVPVLPAKSTAASALAEVAKCDDVRARVPLDVISISPVVALVFMLVTESEVIVAAADPLSAIIGFPLKVYELVDDRVVIVTVPPLAVRKEKPDDCVLLPVIQQL